ncbi:MAG: tRNA uridine-5-carboxymethylaminomethyl(34) synthesis GTPase MnmE [Candidatus Caenarcaniphilales bacterium]|nr:tRNA uridine-5-carboxymethylaminomethyl(34) synthesis GTPase MnmE [Candidatus Caenarcaniphilales bacterium]
MSASYHLPIIIALATPRAQSALAKFRLSGMGVFDLLEKLARKDLSGKIEARQLRALCWLYDRADQPIDQVILHFYPAPASFTGEDLVEIDCHGNPLIVTKITNTALEYGAKLAERGEFSRRALLNHKLDLAQAEAIFDLSHARSNKLIQLANQQLQGSFGKKLKCLQADLQSVLAEIQGALDFPIESEFNEPDCQMILRKIELVKAELEKLGANFQRVNHLRQGVKTVILGRPNVGKSSLLNRLLQEERALVSAEPGTTRDYLKEEILLGDIPLTLIDTAGLRQTAGDQIEERGIAFSHELASQAELILFVYDLAAGWTEEDQAIYDRIKELNAIASLLLLANKSDLLAHDKPRKSSILISAQTGSGFDQLLKCIAQITEYDRLDGEFAVNERQAFHIREAADSLDSISSHIPLEEISLLVDLSLNQLSQSLGGSELANDEETLQAIFGRFCIGK